MAEFHSFTSLPPEQEATFVVFERRTQEALAKGATIGLITGAVVLLISIGVYFGVPPQEDKKGHDMDLNQLKKKSTKTEAPTPDAPK